MATPAARTTFVVPTWNGRERLGHALASIAAQTESDHAVVVVDNGSTDGTDEFLAAEWPGVTVVREDENTGFAAAANRGIAAVRARCARQR
jgi:GT2 family glycosyltransferase